MKRLMLVAAAAAVAAAAMPVRHPSVLNGHGRFYLNEDRVDTIIMNVTCMHVCMHVCMYACMHTCMHA